MTDSLSPEIRRAQKEVRKLIFDRANQLSDLLENIEFNQGETGHYRIDEIENALAEFYSKGEQAGRRAGVAQACVCREPDPVMQADGRFYCHLCSFQTGARPRCLEPEDMLRQAVAQDEIDNGNIYVFCDVVHSASAGNMGCVRGSGHNGPHAFCLPLYPQQPVILRHHVEDQEKP